MTCGWCNTGDHKHCKPKIEYYDKVWYCECKTCKSSEKVEEPNGTE